MPGNPFFHLHALASLPTAQRLAWLTALAASLGHIQQLAPLHPQQFSRFNELLDLIQADAKLRNFLISLVQNPKLPQRRLPAVDSFLLILIYIAHPMAQLQPRVHRFLLQLCQQYGVHTTTLIRNYQRFEINGEAYQAACEKLGQDWLAHEAELRKALRKARSRLHPDHDGDQQAFIELEHLKDTLLL